MKKEISFTGDCWELDIEGISICQVETHGLEFQLQVKLGMQVNNRQLKELTKISDDAQESFYTQFYKITLTPIENPNPEKEE